MLWGAHGAEAAPRPHGRPHAEPHRQGWEALHSSGLWKPAAAAAEQLAPGREGPPGGAGPGVPAVGNQGGRAGVGACPDWDRLGYRGAFVWGFMACEAALPARQEAPIGTRLARGAQGRGQEEGEGGDSTALLQLQHHCRLMAAPGPLKPHARPCDMLAVLSQGWHHLWMEDAAGSGHAADPCSSTQHHVPGRGCLA